MVCGGAQHQMLPKNLQPASRRTIKGAVKQGNLKTSASVFRHYAGHKQPRPVVGLPPHHHQHQHYARTRNNTQLSAAPIKIGWSGLVLAADDVMGLAPHHHQHHH
jgi:hypothetical protein